jgi:predicted alpha/beta-fold hydrolase
MIEPASFMPAPGIGHPILQTAYAAFARRVPALPLAVERWETTDGDFFRVEVYEPPSGARGFLILVHGLEGSSASGYVRGMLQRARERHLVAVALNFRSCGGEENRLAASYHAGFTADLRLSVGRVEERWPGLRGAVIGWSLGANVALKWLSEEGERAPAAVRGAVAVSCPFDLARCAAHLDAPTSVFMRAGFLATLKKKALAKARRLPGVLDARAIRRARTFRAFDDLVTAPLHGFRDASDYWARASSGPLLGRIARPALLISALDDPLIPAACIPWEVARSHPHLRLAVTERGGHVGFVAGSALSPRWWAEERALEFVEHLLEGA